MKQCFVSVTAADNTDDDDDDDGDENDEEEQEEISSMCSGYIYNKIT